MGSTRLPGKVLLDLHGHTVLWHVTRRALAASLVDRILVATTLASDDDEIEAFCRRETIECFRGSETDVLDRYYHAARVANAGTVVRITADCPLLDPAVVDRVIAHYFRGDYDYVANVLHPTFPDGLDVEVMSRRALERTWREARLPSEREHVTFYIRKYPERFRVGEVRNDVDLSALRWTLDEPADLEFIRAVYDQMAGPPGGAGARDHRPRGDAGPKPIAIFGMADVLDVLRRMPALAQLNAGVDNTAWLERAKREQQLADAGAAHGDLGEEKTGHDT